MIKCRWIHLERLAAARQCSQYLSCVNIRQQRSKHRLVVTQQEHHQTHSDSIQAHHAHNRIRMSYMSALSRSALLPDTIGQRVEMAADEYEDRESFVFPHSGDRLTFRTLKERAEELALGLLAIGITKGDRVAIWAPNCLEWILTQYATAMIGAIQVNINPAYKTSELEYSLNKVGCKTIIMSDTYKTQNYVDMLTSICPEIGEASSSAADLKSKRLPQLRSAILIGHQRVKGFLPFDQLCNGGDATHKSLYEKMKRTIQSSDPINIQYTSGTTGFPKGVMLSHHMILNNANQLGNAQEYHKNRTIICLQVPLYHCMGMVMASLTTITSGTTCVLPSPTFNAEESLKAIDTEKCTSLFGTPTMFIDLYNHRNFSKYDVSSLNAGVMAGSTCPVEVVNECITKLKTRNMIVAYGLTETSPIITLTTLHDSLEHRTQTIGRVMEHMEVKVVDKEGLVVPVEEAGELLVRGYNTMLGYWGDEAKTKETYTPDRFLKTGDIVRMDRHGFFRHEGRLKDMVIRGGENIYPREIEEFLHQHECVADVYVIGVPDKRMGEELCAYVKIVHGKSLTQDELKSFCKDKIAHFKIPRYVEFVDESEGFPMTISGKIQKNKLRELFIKKHHLH